MSKKETKTTSKKTVKKASKSTTKKTVKKNTKKDVKEVFIGIEYPWGSTYTFFEIAYNIVDEVTSLV